ncbi:MAG: phosphoribosyltransferase family protein [Chlamydiota bacterium]
MLFNDRKDAGKQLALRLQVYKQVPDTIVIGIARGGVAVAAAVADFLDLPLDVIVIRKIGAPHDEELALGAVSEEGEGVFNDKLIGLFGVGKEYLKPQIEKQKVLIKERLELYRQYCPSQDLQKKTVILIDDGIATGASIRAAIQSLHVSKVNKIILAVPVAATDTLNLLRKEVDEIVCLSTPVFFESVGASYHFFEQTRDEEIIHLLSHQKML